ncbi:MAG TPA: hypothetical protein VN613_12725, partial [Gemmatimonadaceae bacterium]|nr:hypothetical protein [Gemmatimonadaceae bacterium]
ADKQARVEKAARTAISAESTVAAAAASLPSTGKWDEPHLVERLVRAGLAPQARPAEKAEKFWKAPLLAYQVGPAMLHVYLYPDSVARRAIVATLDTLQIAPKGTAAVYPVPHNLIVQNNLAAVLVGGNETQQERVRLALEAGLPAPPRR